MSATNKRAGARSPRDLQGIEQLAKKHPPTALITQPPVLGRLRDNYDRAVYEMFPFWVEGRPIAQSRPRSFANGGVQTDTPSCEDWKARVRMSAKRALRQASPEWHPEDRLPMRVRVDFLIARPKTKKSHDTDENVATRFEQTAGHVLRWKRNHPGSARGEFFRLTSGRASLSGWHTLVPDIDNTGKAVLDAINGITQKGAVVKAGLFWWDDRDVVVLELRKHWVRHELGEREGCWVGVQALLDPPPITPVPERLELRLPRLLLSDRERWVIWCEQNDYGVEEVAAHYNVSLAEAQRWFRREKAPNRPVLNDVDVEAWRWAAIVRRRLGYTTKTMAEYLGMPSRIVARMESGRHKHPCHALTIELYATTLLELVHTDDSPVAAQVRAEFERERQIRVRLRLPE